MIPHLDMGRRKGGGPRKPLTEEQRRYVKAITGDIIKHAENDLHLSRDELAAKAGKKSASTLYGWRNGWRPNPSLVDVQAYASAVGLTLVLSNGTGTHVGSAQCGRPHVVNDFEKTIIAMIRSLPGAREREQLERVVRDFVLTHTSGSHPLPPVGTTPEEPTEQ